MALFQTSLTTIIFQIVILSIFLENFIAKDVNLYFHQDDYHLVTERVDTIRYNRKFMKPSTVRSFKFNRTNIAVNVTVHFKIDIGYELELIIQTYRFASNEYRLFPLRFAANFCEAIKANVVGLKEINCGNFTGCPLLKNRAYHFCNFAPDDSKLPPFIPSGRYLIEIQLMHRSNEMMFIKYYSAVIRPEV